jgi:RNA polymerase sigma-70 factor (ECF subfamily)
MDLLKAARHGKQAAFLQLYDEHHLPLFRFAYRLTRSVADAEDILQECFLGLLRPECSFDPSRTPLLRYLFGAVRNQALKLLRMRQETGGEPEAITDPWSPETEAAQTELENLLGQAIARLPETQREVLILAHYEQLSLTEIAGICEIEVTAVKSRLQRARAALKEMLAAYAPGMEGKR